MEANIAGDPLAHPVIRGSGRIPEGSMESRCTRQERRRSRDLYYFVSGDTVFFTLLYAKNELENLDDAQKNELKRLAQAIEDFR